MTFANGIGNVWESIRFTVYGNLPLLSMDLGFTRLRQQDDAIRNMSRTRSGDDEWEDPIITGSFETYK